MIVTAADLAASALHDEDDLLTTANVRDLAAEIQTVIDSYISDKRRPATEPARLSAAVERCKVETQEDFCGNHGVNP